MVLKTMKKTAINAHIEHQEYHQKSEKMFPPKSL